MINVVSRLLAKAVDCALATNRTLDPDRGVNYAPEASEICEIWILPVTLTTGVFQQRGGFKLNRKKCALLVTALALPLTMGSAFAAEDFDKLEKVACSDLKYSSEFLAKYPTAPAACLEGRVHEGKRYGKFVAKVFLNSPDRTTVELLNVKGDPLTTFSFKAGADAAVKVDGEDRTIQESQEGRENHFLGVRGSHDGTITADIDYGFLGRFAAHAVIGIRKSERGPALRRTPFFSYCVATGVNSRSW